MGCLLHSQLPPLLDSAAGAAVSFDAHVFPAMLHLQAARIGNYTNMMPTPWFKKVQDFNFILGEICIQVFIYIYIYIVISSVRSLDFLGNEAAALRPTVDSLPAPAAHRTDESCRITECLSAKTHDMRCNDMTYECSRQFCHDLMPIAASQKRQCLFFCACFLQINAISCSRIDRDIYIYINI